jgi:hypothetical protein
MASEQERLLRQIRLLLWVVIIGLVLSGVTAIPLETELRMLTRWQGNMGGAAGWLLKIREALTETNAKYPFLSYGTDWLAFGHLVIAMAFVGPLRDPVKNIWMVELGMLACVLVVPFALVMGGVREIPLGWRMIDCSFGIVGIIPLWVCRRKIKALDGLMKESLTKNLV